MNIYHLIIASIILLIILLIFGIYIFKKAEKLSEYKHIIWIAPYDAKTRRGFNRNPLDQDMLLLPGRYKTKAEIGHLMQIYYKLPNYTWQYYNPENLEEVLINFYLDNSHIYGKNDKLKQNELIMEYTLTKTLQNLREKKVKLVKLSIDPWQIKINDAKNGRPLARIVSFIPYGNILFVPININLPHIFLDKTPKRRI